MHGETAVMRHESSFFNLSVLMFQETQAKVHVQLQGQAKLNSNHSEPQTGGPQFCPRKEQLNYGGQLLQLNSRNNLLKGFRGAYFRLTRQPLWCMFIEL